MLRQAVELSFILCTYCTVVLIKICWFANAVQLPVRTGVVRVAVLNLPAHQLSPNCPDYLRQQLTNLVLSFPTWFSYFLLLYMHVFSESHRGVLFVAWILGLLKSPDSDAWSPLTAPWAETPCFVPYEPLNMWHTGTAGTGKMAIHSRNWIYLFVQVLWYLYSLLSATFLGRQFDWSTMSWIYNPPVTSSLFILMLSYFVESSRSRPGITFSAYARCSNCAWTMYMMKSCL